MIAKANAINSFSLKQKINTNSLTEAEIVTVNELHSYLSHNNNIVDYNGGNGGKPRMKNM